MFRTLLAARSLRVSQFTLNVTNSFASTTSGRFSGGGAPANNRFGGGDNSVDIYLGNIDTTVTAEALKRAVASRYTAEFGGPRIVFNKAERRSMGFGYITVPTAAAATEAIAALDGMVVGENTVKVELGQQRRIFRSMFIGNLATTTTEEDLRTHIEATMSSSNDSSNNSTSGSVVDKVRISHHTDGTSRGFAHVDFVDSATRDRALTQLNGVEIAGRVPIVDKAALKTRHPVVYIGNISYDVTAAHLEQMLEEVVGRGNFSDIKLHTDRVTGYPRGFAHVTFASHQIGNKAVEELNGIEMMGRPLRANFATGKRTLPEGNRNNNSSSSSNNTDGDN